MNDTIIEKILHYAPKPTAPSELLKEIQADIALPSAKPAIKTRGGQHPLRRWFPALAFGVLMLSCAIMIAVQASWSTSLKTENEVLRATTADLPQLRERHAALENAQANQDELAQLRKDNEELHSLQAEAAKLRSLPGRIEQLKNENQRLAAAPRTNAGAISPESFFDAAQAEAERIACINNLKQIGLSARVWAGDSDDKYPTSYVVMSNELATAKVLICPSDKARQAYGTLGFNQFQDNMSSYPLTMQPDDIKYPDCITAKCPIHHNYLLSDGSVQSVNPAKYAEVQKDGRWYLQQVQSGAAFRDAIVQPIK